MHNNGFMIVINDNPIILEAIGEGLSSFSASCLNVMSDQN